MSNVKAIIDRMKEATNSRRYEDLANVLGVKLVTINNWKKRGDVPEKNILKCVLLTNKSKEWFLTGKDEHISFVEESVPVYNSSSGNSVAVPLVLLQAGAGEGIYNFEQQETIVSLNPSLFPFASEGKPIAIEIIGDSMQPTLHNGDYIIITPGIADRRDDGIYAIQIDGTIKVKSLHFKLDGTIDIISDNAKYVTETYNPEETQVTFQIIGAKKLHISR